MKLKYFKQVCARDKVIVALSIDKEKCLNYEASTSGNTIENICLRCHGSEWLDSFGLPK